MVYISNTGAYYMANNSAPGVATVNISGTSVSVSAYAVGSTQIAICQNGGQCSTLYVTVSSQTQTQPTETQTYFSLSRYLGPGDKGEDVLQLQKALAKLGLLSATPNGYYGLATAAAVKSFQSQKSIKQTGNVGVATKAALENARIAMSSSSSSISDIQATIDALMAQIRAIRGY
jgi:peptidoglycan hydrolase-like protein with peptidoglycan-binding domain